MTRYGAIVDGKRGAYGVTIPDLPGCYGMGKTIDAALENAASGAVAWAATMRADGYPIPKPRPMEELRNDPEVAADLKAGGWLAIVPLTLDSGRPAKANLSIDAGLLEAIDDAAKARKLTRSTFIASAMREKIMAEG